MKEKYAAIYARVSTVDKGQDVKLQTEELQEYCKRQGWTFIEFVDEASGKDTKRPSLQELLEEVKQGKIHTIVCWKLDRFSRSVLDFHKMVEYLDRYKVRFLCLRDPIDTDNKNPAAAAMRNMIIVFAEFERGMIRERVKAGVARRKAKGLAIGRQRKIVDVYRIEEMSKKGMSIREIAKVLGVGKSTVMNRMREHDEGVI